jgi:hypothetical protein
MKISDEMHRVQMFIRRRKRMARMMAARPPKLRTRRMKLNEADLKRLERAKNETARKDRSRVAAYGKSLKFYHPLHNDETRPLWALNAAARALTGLT